MRLFVFNCLLLASVAVASPNGRHKRDLAHLKNLISSAFFGRSQINIQPEPVLQEEAGYKLFRVPGYEDVMIKVTPKKPVVEEFVYPPAVEKVNLNAFGTVVGTKSKDDTLVAVQGVGNLLSTGILYGGHNNVMKETIVPMFPSINSGNYVVEEKIKTAPLIETRPTLTEVIENRPPFTEVMESRPVFKKFTQSRPVLTEVVKTRPAKKELIDTRPRPVLTEIIESKPVFKEFTQSRPVLTEVVETKPIFKELTQSRPVLTEVVETKPVFKEVFETRPRPVVSEFIETRPRFTELIDSGPVLTEVVRPVEERVEIKVPFEPTYSYKQMKNNEPVMTYTAHTNPGVEVLETIKMKTELPLCIKQRVDEAIVLGADPGRFATEQEVFQYHNAPVFDFSYPRVEPSLDEQNSFRGVVLTEEFDKQRGYEGIVLGADLSRFAPIQEVLRYQNPPVFDFSYPRTEPSLYKPNAFRGEVLTEEFDTVSGFGLAPQRFRPSFQDRPVRYNLRPTKTKAINPRPVPLHSHKSLHFEEDITATKDNVKDNSQKKVQAFNNLGEKVDIAKTLGPIPPQYITNVSNVALSKDKMKQMKAAPIVGSKDNVSNAKIPSNVYRVQVNPNTGKTLKKNSVLRTNVKTNANPSTMAPAVAGEKDNVQVKNIVYTNKVTAKPTTITKPVVVPSINAPKISSLREYIQTSAINKQIVAKEAKNYTYKQMNADGSSLNVNGNKHGVSVNVKDNIRGRGDIPGQK